MSLFSLIVIFVASCCTAFASPNPAWNPNSIFPNGRIVGGEETTIEEHPWQVSLQFNGFAYCGGTIVSNQWILTAAHCAGYSVSSVTVKAGTSLNYQGGTDHRATIIVKHENFHMNHNGVPVNDVALIKVDEPFIFDSTHNSIQLFEHHEESIDGIVGVITGWGTVRQGGSTSDRLRMVRVPIVSKKVCRDAYDGNLPEGQICAAHPQGGKDSCQGDSGGPLTIGGRLAGVVSWGNGCGKPGYPGVYTEIATYRNWIADKAGI